ncbi:MAG: class I SAM-dependent methyltransferase [Candidatus Pacearchaeota archaeon]|jgi:ubiquinone/menaquinone biosynthesis C-methylase UbiE
MFHGSALAEFDEIDIDSADGVKFKLKNNFLTRLAFKIIGLPHIESRIRAKRIFSFLPKKSFGKKVLDAGCGYGLHSLELKKRNFEVYSTDINPERINFLKQETKGLKLSVEDLTNLSFPDNSFDFIICSDVLEHIKKDKKAFQEITKVLKKSGILCLTVPSVSRQNLKNQKKYGHERIGYRIKDIKILAEENNLKIKEVKPYSGKIVEKAFEINEKIYKNKILLGLLFYPLYLSSFMEDIFGLNKKYYNGAAYKLVKV